MTRARPWIAVIGAAIVFAALIFLFGLPWFYALPLIGVALAAGAPPDYVADAKPVARRPRNLVIGIVVLILLAVVVLQPQLNRWLVGLFGLEIAGLVVMLVAVAALALPLLMADSANPIKGLPENRLVLTRRNLMLCLTVAVTVAEWYAGPGLSFLAIAAFVLVLPVPLALSRLLAARRGRLEFGLLRQPLGANLLPHRIQFLNVLLLCGLLASALFTGAYHAATLDLSLGAHRALQITFLGGLLVLLLSAAVPLQHVRLASNVLVLASSLFMATQLVMIYRPAENPVPIASPLAEEWLVGQGGHAELVNYHYVTSTQRDALDILQTRDGRTHQSGSAELTSYYIYGKSVLAPAAGTVTFVLDGRPDLPIGSTDSHYQSGNNIVIDIGGGRYLLMGHLSPGSIQVKVGDQVKPGQPIAKVGNSGNTSEPHLHIQAQNASTGIGDIATMDVPTIIRTLHTYPLVFSNMVLTRRGTESQPESADPRRGDLLRPAS
jgi:Peptidase family M23